MVLHSTLLCVIVLYGTDVFLERKQLVPFLKWSQKVPISRGKRNHKKAKEKQLWNTIHAHPHKESWDVCVIKVLRFVEKNKSEAQMRDKNMPGQDQLRYIGCQHKQTTQIFRVENLSGFLSDPKWNNIVNIRKDQCWFPPFLWQYLFKMTDLKIDTFSNNIHSLNLGHVISSSKLYFSAWSMFKLAFWRVWLPFSDVNVILPNLSSGTRVRSKSCNQLHPQFMIPDKQTVF